MSAVGSLQQKREPALAQSAPEAGSRAECPGVEFVAFGATDRPLLKEFVQFPWRLYKDDPYYVPPLNMSFLGSRLLGEVGLLTAEHPFHAHAEVVYYLAYRDGEIVGRVAGCVDPHHNRDNKSEDVVFGFFECVDDSAIAAALIDRVAAWGRAKGMKRLLGPMSFNTNHVIGLQLDAYDTQPYFETTHNHPYYPALMDACGLRKEMDVIAQRSRLTEDVLRAEPYLRAKALSERILARRPITIRSLNMKKLEEEKGYLREIYNEAWNQNWGATALTDEEFSLITDQLKVVADPDLVLLAFVDGEAAALLGALPDYYDCIKRTYDWLDRFELTRIIRLILNRRRTPRSRALLMGIKKKFRRMGLKDLLTIEMINRMLAKKQVKEIEFSWMLETNTAVLRAGEIYKAERYKTWRIYQRGLDECEAGS